MRSLFERTFGYGDLPGFFFDLTPYASQGEVLIPFFHVVAWQIRLRLLDPNSIEQIAVTSYVREDNTYQTVINGRGITFSMRWVPMNRSSFAGLSELERSQMPDRGMFPPPPMLMIKEIVITGYDEESVQMACNHLREFVAARMYTIELHEQSFLEKIKRFARNQLADQNYPWLSLKPEVAEFYGITSNVF